MIAYKIGLLDSTSICSIQLKFLICHLICDLNTHKDSVPSGLREAVKLTSNTGNNVYG